MTTKGISGRQCGSGVEHWPSMHGALSLFLGTIKERRKKENHSYYYHLVIKRNIPLDTCFCKIHILKILLHKHFIFL